MIYFIGTQVIVKHGLAADTLKSMIQNGDGGRYVNQQICLIQLVYSYEIQQIVCIFQRCLCAICMIDDVFPIVYLSSFMTHLKLSRTSTGNFFFLFLVLFPIIKQFISAISYNFFLTELCSISCIFFLESLETIMFVNQEITKVLLFVDIFSQFQEMYDQLQSSSILFASLIV